MPHVGVCRNEFSTPVYGIDVTSNGICSFIKQANQAVMTTLVIGYPHRLWKVGVLLMHYINLTLWNPGSIHSKNSLGTTFALRTKNTVYFS